MLAFIRVRGPRVAGVMVVMLAISLAQGGISYTMTFGALSDFMPRDRSTLARGLLAVSVGSIALMAALWALKRRRALFVCVIFANTVFTCALLVHLSGLVGVLYGSVSEAVNALMFDVVLMASTNILIFSIWYWVIDPPGFEDVPHADEAGISCSRNAPVAFRTINPGSLATPITSSWPSRPVSRSVRPTPPP